MCNSYIVVGCCGLIALYGVMLYSVKERCLEAANIQNDKKSILLERILGIIIMKVK